VFLLRSPLCVENAFASPDGSDGGALRYRGDRGLPAGVLKVVGPHLSLQAFLFGAGN
jgi:hypothetical protein